MTGISLQQGIIYGPIFSRRIGRSLGINLLPINEKLCSFDCIYCQYGRTNVHTIDPRPETFPSVDSVLSAIEYALKKPRTINYLTFSGNGEPTLHPDFLEIVKGTRRLMEQFRPDTKLALFSNSSLINKPLVISSLELIDLPMMKLDAGDEGTFQAINQPVRSVRFSEIVQGLRTIPNLVIQSMLIDGCLNNIQGDNYKNWVRTIVELEPQAVHIYSAERPPNYRSVKRVHPTRLIRIKKDLQTNYGLSVQVYWRE